MSDLIGTISSIIALLVGVAVWTILFVVILEVLKKASPFAGWTCHVIMAASICLLSVIGMFRMLGGAAPRSETATDRDLVGCFLLPYAAMGISMLVLLLLTFLRKHARARRHSTCTPEAHDCEAAEEYVPRSPTGLPHHYPRVTECRDDETRPQGKAERPGDSLSG